MKEFNLQRALAGDPVVTRGGLPVEEMVLLTNKRLTHKVVAVIDGGIFTYNEKGEFLDVPDVADLFMAPVKKQEWGYIWRLKNQDGYMFSYPFENEAETIENSKRFDHIEIIRTVLIREWEE